MVSAPLEADRPPTTKRWCHDCDTEGKDWHCFLCGSPTSIERPRWLQDYMRDETSNVLGD